jgi:thiol:disulfide interchange protein
MIMKYLFSILLAVFSLSANSQVIDPIKWSFHSTQNEHIVDLVFTATMDQGWHLYDTELPEGGPVSTAFVYEDSTLFEFVGGLLKTPPPTQKFDEIFSMNLRYYSDTVVFKQQIRIKEGISGPVKGYVSFMGCNEETCLPPNEIQFSFQVSGTADSATSKVTLKEPVSNASVNKGENQSLWLFILIAALAGLAAVLTPCVFPMIPMTVSFFMRSAGNRKRSLRTALIFGISIVAIFTLLGALFSFGVFGPNVGSVLSTHWIPNLIFFTLFLVFALSFFGLFEIVLPGSLVNKTDAQADKGGIAGAFFMALTTVIVSFSCTGPFIGALIIQAVQSGGLRPLIGLFFFGLAFATPFTFLAIFPSALNKLPKSGGWLNAIKIVFAFTLLAFGLKFLSNIDQVYGLNILSRELYLIIWIVIFTMMGLYLLGKIKFELDSDLPHLGVGRLFLSMITFVFVLYLFTGLLGAPLQSVSALIPPATEKVYPAAVNKQVSDPGNQELCGPAKFADKLHLPQGLHGYFDFNQGLACAREQSKPLLVVFKGHACANCKKMENSVWNDPEVLRLLSEKFVITGLYTDDRSTLPGEDWVTLPDGKVLKTMGKVNLQLQIEKYNTNSIPFHVIIRPDGQQFQMAVTFNTKEFRDFLQKGI